MKRTETIQHKLSAEPQLNQQIDELLNHIVSSKRLQFNTEDTSMETTDLLRHGLLEIREKTLYVKTDEILAFKAFTLFAGKFEYETSNDIASLIAFLQKTDEFFDTNPGLGITAFLNGIRKIAMQVQHEDHKPDYLAYIEALPIDENSDEDFGFINSFIEVFPEIIFDPEIILKIVRKLYGVLKYDEPGVYNVNIAKLNSALISYCINNKNQAHALFDLLGENYDEINRRLSLPVLSAIFWTDNDMEFLKILATTDKFHWAVISMLALRLELSSSQAQAAIELVETIHSDDQKIHSQKIEFYGMLLRNKQKTDPAIRTYALEKLLKLASRADTNIANIIARQLEHLHDLEKLELLKSLLENAALTPDFFGGVGFLISQIKDPKIFFEFLYGYTEKFKSRQVPFLRQIGTLRHHNPEVFDKELINMLIHDNGRFRVTADTIFLEIARNSKTKEFAFPILSLSPEQQFKLFTAILASILEPKHTVSFLIEIVNSSNDFVREAFICRLESLTEEYGGAVVPVLKVLWPTPNESQSAIINRIINYDNTINEATKIKNRVKELDPLYVQGKYFQRFMREHKKKFSREMNQGVEKNSVTMQLFKTVKIAKGGGWKVRQDDKMSQMGIISTSFSFPRSYFISPDHYDWNRLHNIADNWQNLLTEWTAVL